MMNSKAISIVIALILAILLCACGGSSNSPDTKQGENIRTQGNPVQGTEKEPQSNIEGIEEQTPLEPVSEPVQSDEQPNINKDIEIITRSNHPTYYGSVEQSHTVWGDVEKGKIHFADSYDKAGDTTIISMGASRNSDIIKSITISFYKFEEPVDFSLDDALPIIASYLPFDILDKYYEFSNSKLIVPDESRADDPSYYVITYHLTEDGKSAYYSKEHQYFGTVDVIILVNNGIVYSVDYTFGTPRWMSSLSINSYHSDEWECDLYNYRT